jgi:very-short-patch-repair endonuclease
MRIGEAVNRTEASTLLEMHLRELVIGFTREYRFCLARKWRADFMFSVNRRVFLLEIDGGAWTRGRHTRGAGFIADMEKQNMGSALGYRWLRFTPDQVLKGEAKRFIADRLLAWRKGRI